MKKYFLHLKTNAWSMSYYAICYILIMIVVNKNIYLSTSLLLYHSLLFFPSFLLQKHLKSNWLVFILLTSLNFVL
jgi:hypothetical protein